MARIFPSLDLDDSRNTKNLLALTAFSTKSMRLWFVAFDFMRTSSNRIQSYSKYSNSYYSKSYYSNTYYSKSYYTERSLKYWEVRAISPNPQDQRVYNIECQYPVDSASSEQLYGELVIRDQDVNVISVHWGTSSMDQGWTKIGSGSTVSSYWGD